MVGTLDWLRARGLSRERFAGYLERYLTTLGYRVERSESPDPPESRITAHLEKMNPSVPPSARTLSFRLVPTANGSSAAWVEPKEVPAEERGAMGRLVLELVQHLERAISTESRATAKVQPAPVARLPWEPEIAPDRGRFGPGSV
jgi:hypothetical protein